MGRDRGWTWGIPGLWGGVFDWLYVLVLIDCRASMACTKLLLIGFEGVGGFWGSSTAFIWLELLATA